MGLLEGLTKKLNYDVGGERKKYEGFLVQEGESVESEIIDYFIGEVSPKHGEGPGSGSIWFVFYQDHIDDPPIFSRVRFYSENLEKEIIELQDLERLEPRPFNKGQVNTLEEVIEYILNELPEKARSRHMNRK